jgi:AcrR family transcriptional regulator
MLFVLISRERLKGLAMGETSESRSVRRTRKALQNSLIELMKDHSILRISVKEICDTADVGRSTFYAHYKDQYELLRELEDQPFITAERIAQKYKFPETKKLNPKDIPGAVQELMEYIANNSDFIQVLLSENGDSYFQKRFLRMHLDRMHHLRKNSGSKQNDEKMLKYYSFFAIGGFLALIQEWLKSGMDMPLSEMVKMLTHWAQEIYMPKE